MNKNIIFLLSSLLVCASSLYADVFDGFADKVLGQIDFTHNKHSPRTGNNLYSPERIAICTVTGRIYVADCHNNRVLWWNDMASLSNGEYADGVLGQKDFEGTEENDSDGDGAEDTVAPNTLHSPFGIAVDGSGNLWVADTDNNRVLKYSTPTSNGAAADLVLGQQDFDINAGNDMDGDGEEDTVAPNTLYSPIGIAVDGSGNVWVSDASNNRVLKYNTPSSSGEDADLVLGQDDLYSSNDDVAVDALHLPLDIALDGSGNVWVADGGNNRVLKYNTPSSSGEDADLVLGQQDFDINAENDSDGDGSTDTVAANTLQFPYGLAVDGSGNVWVADTDNHRILKYNAPSSNGEAADLVLGQQDFDINAENDSDGDGSTDPTAANNLKWPSGVLVDSPGNVWVADNGNNRVLKYNTPSSSGEDADLVLGQPDFIHYYVTFAEGIDLGSPYDMAVCPVTGKVYVADGSDNRVLWWNNADSFVNGGSADGVLGQQNLNLSKANDSDGDNATDTVAANTLKTPYCVEVDDSGNVWVADGENHRVLKYDTPSSSGEPAVLVLGQQDFLHNAFNDTDGDGSTDPVAANTLYKPHGLAFDSSGNLWVTEYGNNRVLKYAAPFSNGESAVLVLGQQSFTVNAANDSDGDGSTDAVAADTIYHPLGIDVDSFGNVWVADHDNHRVLKYNTPSSNGEAADLVLGQQSFTVHAPNDSDGDGATDSVAANTLKRPHGVEVDSSGNVWVGDYENNRVLVYRAPSSSGESADLVLGQQSFTVNAANDSDGNGTTDSVSANTLDNPRCVEVDSTGHVWVADCDNNRILKFYSLSVLSITPDHGDNSGTIDITGLLGHAFGSGVSVRLTKTGESDIKASKVSAVSSGKLTCRFDLTDKEAGKWDIKVTKSGIKGILSSGFKIKYTAAKTEEIFADRDNTFNMLVETGRIMIEVPEAAFSKDVTMTVKIIDVPRPDRDTLKKTDIGIDISVSGDLQPLKEITLTINYRDEDIEGLEEDKLAVCRYDSLNRRWIPLPTTVYASKNYMEAKLDHLSKFGVLQLAAASDLNSVKVFPNPYNPSSGVLTFDNLTQETTIKIYTVAGTLIREIKESDGDGRSEWDGTNNASETVACGVYVVYIECSKDNSIIKIGVVK
ncbi:MAG: hypothetical protein JXJ19_05475 [Elusimicrobia bacterium]|nr:hypothetical protein [Elusimicrobiota bacterium]